MAEISILLVGSTDRAEFREARAVLDGLGRVVVAAEIKSATCALASGVVVPDVIVVAQSYPGQFPPEVVDRLRRLAPLARLLGLLGSWCEGETRTGQPWPAAIRIYWHEWLPRVEPEFALLREGECSTLALPVTAGEEERLLLLADRPLTRREGLVAVSTPQLEMYGWLATACARHGYSSVWLQPHRAVRVEGAIAAIFDAGECRGEEIESLADLAVALGPAPIIALLDFPRVEDRSRALAAGARAVLSKPVLIGDLFWQIDRISYPPAHAAFSR